MYLESIMNVGFDRNVLIALFVPTECDCLFDKKGKKLLSHVNHIMQKSFYEKHLCTMLRQKKFPDVQ